MKYDPIKKSLGTVFNKTPILRKLFYSLLDLLLLRAWYIKKELRLWNPKSNNLNLLDAGAGFGQYTFFMSKFNKSWNIDAVDVKQEQIDDCNNFFTQINRADKIRFQYGDLTKFVKENNYDFILSVDVMEHIEDDNGVFRNFHKSLKAGGMLLISTPSDQGGSDVHDHDDEESFIDEHVRDGYNIDDIIVKLKNAGFSKAEAKYSYGNSGQISWRLSMKYPIMLLNVSKIFFIIIPFYYLITFPFSLILNYIDTNRTHKTGTGLIVKAWK